jgi:hypothetical protein
MLSVKYSSSFYIVCHAKIFSIEKIFKRNNKKEKYSVDMVDSISI